MSLKVHFIDSGREPKCAPNPAFPRGMDIDISRGASRACETALPYPAPRCGYMAVKCESCGQSVLITVAGRPDDPRTVKLPCRLN